MDNKKLASICLVPPTLRELRTKQQALEMKKKKDFANFELTKKCTQILS
jgi:hypothetical protein